jgi:hypothetical protein
VRASPEMDVRAGEPGELGQPEPGLKRHDEEGVVPPPGPGGLVRSGEERLGLASVEEGPGRRVGALLGDGKSVPSDERRDREAVPVMRNSA